MKSRKIRFGVLVGALTILIGCIGMKTYAKKQSQSLTVSPPTQSIVLIPGESYSNSLRISNANSSTRDLKYSVHIGSFSENGSKEGKDDYGTVDHISVSNYNQIMDWISFDKEEGTVAPNTTDIVTYTINVPDNAPAGGQYATIIIRDETGSANGENNGNVAISSVYQFASIIYAEVAGETRQTGTVLDNSIPTFSFDSPFTVSSTVENSGNVHTDAKYTLQIWPLFSNEEIYTNEEEPMTSLILPETKRYNVQMWDESPSIGIFKVKQIVEIFGETSTIEKIVILCPLWILLMVVFVVVAIIIWIIARYKANKKQAE